MSAIRKEVQPNPYLITGPALISFSGGRTSAFMLHEILRAHDGKLPDDVVVAFANTGKEREETLRFVHECGSRWNVHVNWLQWLPRKPSFEVVGFNSAARNGEPFKELIDRKQRPPNQMQRYCTEHLKVKTLMSFAASLGWTSYLEVIGLRYDEGHRIFKGLANADKHERRNAYPLSKAKITKRDIMAFWERQPFDLGLQSWEGNCDLCFLKGKKIREQIIRDNPDSAAWWIEQETTPRGGKGVTGWFDKEASYADLASHVARSPLLFDAPAAEEYDVECGLHCAPESEAA